LSTFQSECAIVSQYYLPTRYPDATVSLSPAEAEAQEALGYARAIVTAIDTRLAPPVVPTDSDAP